ncbi:MAG: tyrosine-type recombinase/integrase [bacterium]|nr:tyrosine-type recombinase/integrase [bacterium]
MGTINERVQKDGSTRYRALIRIKKGGKIVHTQSETFSKKTMAQAWLDRTEAALAVPGALEAKQYDSLLVGDVLRRYREEVAETGGFGRTKVAHLKQLEGMELADLPAVPLTTQQLMAHLRQRRAAGAGPATVGNDLIWLRSAFKYGKHAWGIPLPVQAIQEAAESGRISRLIGKSKSRDRRPLPEEIELLDAHFRKKLPRVDQRTPPMRLMMWLAIYSCRRLDEQCSILRADLHRESGTYLVRDMKHPDGSAGNHHTALLPEHGWLVVDEILRTVPDVDGRLLPVNSKTVSAYFTRACKILGIVDLHYHDFRHEGASRIAEDGATIPEIQQVTLHESWSSLQIYVNLRGRRQRRVDFIP